MSAFRDGEIDGIVATRVRRWPDKRGWLIETFRHDELEDEFFPVMGYTSLSLPGVVRGPHEHVDQADLFVFLGPGLFKIWLWDNRRDSKTYFHRQILTGGQEEPLRLLVPKGVVHAYRNIAAEPGIVQNFPNQLYMGQNKKSLIDEIRHEDDPNTIFKVD